MSNRSKNKISEKLIGPVRALHDGSGFVELANHDNLLLNKREMSLIFPGDVVEVRAGKAKRGDRAQGYIVDVLEHNTPELVGRFCFESDMYFVRPSNSRIVHDVRLAEKATGAQPGDMVVVEIHEQPNLSGNAYGVIKQILGSEFAAGMEIQVALHNFDIPHSWSKAVSDQADSLGTSVKQGDKQHRLDLRTMPFVTIDGEDARDFDDAVYVEAHKQGWRLWVAIADVSHYVKPGSPLDTEAQHRGTSVYFPDYVVPMLPEALSNGLCSLKPKLDRLALVCEMEINAEGQITNSYFAEAVIRSHERLTYSRVAQVIAERNEQQTPQRDALGSLCEQLDQLHKVYKVLSGARQRRGAMEFESLAVRFEFNDNRKIEKILPVTRNDAHKLIEECMLCANICAADFLQKNTIAGLYRVHMPPANEKLSVLRDYLTELGLYLGGGDQPSPADFKKLTEAIADRPDKSMIQTMMLRSQQQAVYQPENKGHFGLAYDAYAHFTSPIRRYPDLMVHRAIRSMIRSGKTDAAHVHRVKGAKTQTAQSNYPYDLQAIQVIGQNCSLAERRAEAATRDVEQWLKCEYLQKHLGESLMGVVATVTRFGLFVLIDDFYVEGLIHIASLPRDYYEFDEASQQLIGQSYRRTFKAGDRAMVQIARVDLDERKIDLLLTDTDADEASSKSAFAKRSHANNEVRSKDPDRHKKTRSRKTSKNKKTTAAAKQSRSASSATKTTMSRALANRKNRKTT